MKTNLMLLLLLAVFLFITPSITKAQVDIQDSLALVDLYNSTDGPHWTNAANWLTKQPLGTWYGVHLEMRGDGDSTKVYWIDLANNNLKGTLPPSLGNLDRLRYLFLNNNQLSGNIPSFLGNLSFLKELNLGYNKLKGIIPSNLGNLFTLIHL